MQPKWIRVKRTLKTPVDLRSDFLGISMSLTPRSMGFGKYLNILVWMILVLVFLWQCFNSWEKFLEGKIVDKHSKISMRNSDNDNNFPALTLCFRSNKSNETTLDEFYELSDLKSNLEEIFVLVSYQG